MPSTTTTTVSPRTRTAQRPADHQLGAADPEAALQLAFTHVGRQMRARLAPHGDPATVSLLQVLASEGPLRSSAVAELLHLDASTVSRHVRALETAGWLARTEDPADRRAALLSVTASGQAFLGDCLDRRSALVRTATTTWSDEDVTLLAGLLERLAQDLGELPSRQETL